MAKEYGASQTKIRTNESVRSTIKWLGISAIFGTCLGAMGLTFGMIAMNKSSQRETVYFAAREDGSIIPLIGVEQPYLSDNAVMNFAVEAVSESLSLSFVDLEDDLQKSNIYFTKPAGWNAFLTTLNDSQMLEFIRNRRVVSNVIAQNPRITKRGMNSDGAYSWTLEVPLSIKYMASSSESEEKRRALVEIVRVPTWSNSRAVGIRQIAIQRAN